MGEGFKSFIDQIPPDIMAKTESYSTPNLIIFRPSSYVAHREVYFEDYHISLPTATPPPTKVENREYQFKKGKIILFTPETKVRCTSNASTGKYIAMCIKKDFFQKVTHEVMGKRYVSFSNVNNPYSSKLLNLIWTFEEEMGYSKDSSRMMLDSISTQIVIQLLREMGLDSTNEEKRIVVDNDYISLAMEYITAYFNANIRIEDICRQIHLSPFYFIRMFKKKTGTSPHEFLLSVRVSKAEEMLKRGGCSIEEAAKFCGFANTAHFSARFKKVKGISPSEYKKAST